MKIIDALAEQIRKGEVTPDEALAELQSNEVYVWPESDDPDTWGGVEDRGANYSGIHHALAAVGAVEMLDAFSAEVARLRSEGNVITL